MILQRDSGWMRRGVSLLWDAVALSKVVSPEGVRSIRELFAMSRSWPEELPGFGGDALVVAGVEGCLDALAHDNGQVWLETDLKPVILQFQDEYEGQAALILWLPSGRSRISMVPATEEYLWKTRSHLRGSLGFPSAAVSGQAPSLTPHALSSRPRRIRTWTEAPTWGSITHGSHDRRPAEI